MSTIPVSVIIPCYRCGETVSYALSSVLNQTLLPAEILLIDDASGDGTLEILQQLGAAHAPRVRVLTQMQNGGPGVARNTGWLAATQPWLAFLDADDAWHPRKLEIQWGWIVTYPEVVLCGHDTRFSEGQIDLEVDSVTTATRLTTWRMLFSNRLPTRSVMLRRDLPFRFQGRDVTEDYLLWLQVIIANLPVYRLATCLAYTLRPDFSPGGYSGQLWIHEKRELRALQMVRNAGGLSWLTYLLASGWSLLKFVRRLWLMRSA